jgi:hypothetical protein
VGESITMRRSRVIPTLCCAAAGWLAAGVSAAEGFDMADAAYLALAPIPAAATASQLEDALTRFEAVIKSASSAGDTVAAARAAARRAEILARLGRVMSRPDKLAQAAAAATDDPLTRVLAANAVALSGFARGSAKPAVQAADEAAQLAHALQPPDPRRVGDVEFDRGRIRGLAGYNRTAFDAFTTAYAAFEQAGASAAAEESLFSSVAMRAVATNRGVSIADWPRLPSPRSWGESGPPALQQCDKEAIAVRHRLVSVGLAVLKYDLDAAGAPVGEPQVVRERGDGECAKIARECLGEMRWPALDAAKPEEKRNDLRFTFWCTVTGG